jgi:dihydroorotate dehydrogenase (fumarate)
MSIDLSTDYLGIRLKNPIVVSACPLTRSMSCIKRLQAAGASAIVLQSVFAEQIEREELEWLRHNKNAHDTFLDSDACLPNLLAYNGGPRVQLEFIEDAKKEVSIPIIASLNGDNSGRWLRYSNLFQKAGADAIELNLYHVPVDPSADAMDVEKRYIDLVAKVAQQVTIPLAVKIGPYFSSLPNFATKLVGAGASGLVLFNRYLEPDVNVEALTVEPCLSLSTPSEQRLSLRWIGVLRDQLHCSLAATTGIHSAEQVLKALLTGANVAMLASVLLKRGPDAITTMLAELEVWLARHRYQSVDQIIGMLSRGRIAGSSAFERANYMKALMTPSETRPQVANP